MVIAVIQPKSWILEVFSRYNAKMRIHDCTPFGRKGSQALIEVDVDPGTLNTLHASIISHPDVLKFDIAHKEDGKIIGSVAAKNWTECSTIMNSDCYVKDARWCSSGMMEWRLLTPTQAALKDLIANVQNKGCEVWLRNKKTLDTAHILTARQEYVIIKANELGYYNYPRGITAIGLSRQLNISPSTLSEILKRAEQNLIEFYLKETKERK
ncbi:MAG: helix-turn-helix domain-containing protein [Methanomassiliicoccales archaeon]|nr:helix-turn-helix domain-containing protein [Methanomassiliicoccales archaeon]